MRLATRRLPSAFTAAFLYTLRVCVPPRRWALLLLPFAGSLLFGLLARVVDERTAADSFDAVTEGLFGLILPFACLVVGDAVAGAEVRSGTFALTWLSPMRFSSIVAARWLGGWAIGCGVLVPAMVGATLVAGVPEGARAIVTATVAATAAYIALFVVIGVTTRRAALWSLGVVLLGERLLGAALSGIAQLSPQWLARSVYAGLGPGDDGRSGVPAGWAGVVRLAVITVVLLAIAVRRVRVVRLAPSSD